jgi:hypothetical protein
MLDRDNTVAERVLAWAKLRAWGNYSDFAVDEDLRPLVQIDCAAQLGLTKQLVNNAVRAWVARGYIRMEGRMICPIDAPERKESDAGSNAGTDRSPSYRAFLETWAVNHPDEYREFEQVKERLRTLQSRILHEYRTAKRQSPTPVIIEDEGHPRQQPEVTHANDAKSPTPATNASAISIEEVFEGLEELLTAASSSTSAPPDTPAASEPSGATTTTTALDFSSEIIRIFVEAGKDNPTKKQIREVASALPDHPEAPARFLETLKAKISRIRHPGGLMIVVEGFIARWPAILEIVEQLNRQAAAGPASKDAAEEIAAFLTNCADTLDRQPGFESIAGELQTMARDDLNDPAAVEIRLAQLGSQMAVIARSRVDMAQLAAEIDRDPELLKYKRQMSQPQYGALRDQLIERRLRQSLKLPALSLFYLR